MNWHVEFTNIGGRVSLPITRIEGKFYAIGNFYGKSHVSIRKLYDYLKHVKAAKFEVKRGA